MPEAAELPRVERGTRKPGLRRWRVEAARGWGQRALLKGLIDH